jgi:hypothetical protein
MKTIAEDQFDRYYTEKLWEMIPAIYRHEDGIAEERDVLRSLVKVLAEQAAILRRSQDRLWEDQFIAFCNDWAVPYIADLVGTRLLTNLNKRGQRIDVAKTIYYRRRKGTPRILEELISDISNWEGKVVENFLHLARARHGLDPFPSELAGRFSKTMPDGWADLRHPRISELVDSPFDEFFHTPDVRKHRGHQGRYNIPKLAIHLYRLKAYPVKEITPFSLSDKHCFTFDPSGREIPLFSRRNRADDWDEWHSALEWELPAPIRCRLLGHAEYLISEAAIQFLITKNGLGPAAGADLRHLNGWNFQNESQLLATLSTLPTQATLLTPTIYTSLLRYTIVEECGKQALLPNALSVNQAGQTLPDHGSMSVSILSPAEMLAAEYITSGGLENWLPIAPTTDKKLIIDPENGRFMFPNSDIEDSNLTASYHYGFSGPFGAGTYTRLSVEDSEPTMPLKSGGGVLAATDISNNGVTQIDDNKTYSPVSDKISIINLTLQAANKKRPFLRLDKDWKLKTIIQNAQLTLDGLWIGGTADTVCNILIQGDYECVTIRHCTLDPGGSKTVTNKILHPVTLIIEGSVQNLCISNSILGPIRVEPTGLVESVSIEDSIVQSISTTPAIHLHSGVLMMERVTVFGSIKAHRLQASEVLVTQKIDVMDTQTGCFRFSAAPTPPLSRLPRPYECFLFKEDSHHWFTSQTFGQPGYAQLSETIPINILRGAENGSEMGFSSSLINPIKSDNLKTKIEEYMPFGLIPIFIHKT